MLLYVKKAILGEGVWRLEGRKSTCNHTFAYDMFDYSQRFECKKTQQKNKKTPLRQKASLILIGKLEIVETELFRGIQLIPNAILNENWPKTLERTHEPSTPT